MSHSEKFNLQLSLRAAASALAIVFVLTVVATQTAQAQTFKVLHAFTGGLDGGYSEAALTMDAAGNLYGTTFSGGYPGTCAFAEGCGAVFMLTRRGSHWILSPIYAFQGGNDGSHPFAKVIFGPDGNLYGTTLAGGIGPCTWNSDTGCGTVFKLTRPAAACTAAVCPWTETVLYRFASGSDGASPVSEVTFDPAGNVYGTTPTGGGTGCAGGLGCGTVYKLTPSNGGWTESIIYSFSRGDDGWSPEAGVIFDKTGNLYSTTVLGGSGCSDPGCGVVYELTPSGSGWTENVLYAFRYASDGAFPLAPPTFDSLGNLYGTTSDYGPNGGGTVFELTPSAGGWTFTLLYSFVGTPGSQQGPDGPLVMDAAGSLYDTTKEEGTHWGAVFKLTPSGGGWTYTSLHVFDAGSDGGFPWGGIVFDANGDLYGTAATGGTYNNGVVWEITP